jgi:transcriptional regulator CtsR
MSVTRAEYLIDRLISNNLSADELQELLNGVSNEKEQRKISDVLEKYFNRLLQEDEAKKVK